MIQNIRAPLIARGRCVQIGNGIDDDENTVRLFSEFLEENKINVVCSGFDGVTAVRLFKETKPDVVLIDLNMSNGSGFYAIKKIQEIDPKARIIAELLIEVTALKKNWKI
jgi:chemotaxis response regulator CheB